MSKPKDIQIGLTEFFRVFQKAVKADCQILETEYKLVLCVNKTLTHLRPFHLSFAELLTHKFGDPEPPESSKHSYSFVKFLGTHLTVNTLF